MAKPCDEGRQARFGKESQAIFVSCSYGTWSKGEGTTSEPSTHQRRRDLADIPTVDDAPRLEQNSPTAGQRRAPGAHHTLVIPTPCRRYHCGAPCRHPLQMRRRLLVSRPSLRHVCSVAAFAEAGNGTYRCDARNSCTSWLHHDLRRWSVTDI